MRTLYLEIIVIVISCIVSCFTTYTAFALYSHGTLDLEKISNSSTTQLKFNGSTITFEQYLNKTTYKVGETIYVYGQLRNVGNNDVYVSYPGPATSSVLKDQSDKLVDSFGGAYVLDGGPYGNETLHPNTTTTLRVGDFQRNIVGGGLWSIQARPANLTADEPGTYYVRSMTTFSYRADPTSEHSKTITLWSKPLYITILPENYLQNTANHTIPQSVKLTPFDISFLKNDFNRTGISHQILVLKPNQTSSIHAMIYNNDNKTQQVYLQAPKENLGNFVSSYSFEPSTLTIYPHSVNETILHITAANINDTQTGLVSILAQDKSFGIRSNAFYLAVGNDIPDSRLDFIDQSLRETMPGTAFPNLHPVDLKQNQIAGNAFGIPAYLPPEYKLQGISGQSPELLVYSPVPVTYNTTNLSFLHSGGITVYYQTNDPSFDLYKWMPLYIGQNEAQEISVNGMTGVAIEQQKRQTDNIQFMSESRVLLFKGTSQIELGGNIQLDELLKMASSVPVTGKSQAALTQCGEDKDFPGKPCNDAIDTANPNQKPILGDKSDWQAFYNMKGKDWMESKKQEMYFADQNGILKEWYGYGSNSGHLANSDVWYYYSLYGESPDIAKYYNGMVQKNWIYPIVTYYYANPIVFVILGVVTVVGFFMSRKILVRIRK